ncbi:acyl carrier protein [Delftia acidovorans]|uniref:acyl carrier protein n=1 Tax=Delftia acidovorans TaxID=80866 RepID=UPI00359F575D
MPSIDQFIESFLTAVDFQEAVEVTPETELRSLPEWDSLAALGVIVMFDVDYGKTITGDDLKNCSTITALYKLLGYTPWRCPLCSTSALRAWPVAFLSGWSPIWRTVHRRNARSEKGWYATSVSRPGACALNGNAFPTWPWLPPKNCSKICSGSAKRLMH